MRPVRYLITIGVCGFWMATIAAQLPGPVQSAVAAYRRAVKAVDSRPPGTGVEPTFNAFRALRAVLTRHEGLEALTEQQFGEVRSLKGVIVSRDEVIYVQPDVRFFGALARAHGDAADRAFFAALKATYPDSVWPAYIEQQTDDTGCTRFGSLSVAAAYVRWVDFRKRYPTRYRDEATEQARAAFERLTGSTCACGDAVGVERELEQALRDVHAPGPRAAVERRLQEVRAGRADIRGHCHSGD